MRTFTRRQSLQLTAGAMLGLLSRPMRADSPMAQTAGLAKSTLVLTPEAEEGPFYLDLERVRRDVREDRPGIPLRLQVAVIDAGQRLPLPGAAVDIWHCDASGVYSGFAAQAVGHGFGPHPGGPPPGHGPGDHPFGPPPDFARGGGPPRSHPTDAKTFLRGVQLTGAHGMVEFLTIYPGWYQGRGIHIHLKVHVSGQALAAHYGGGHVCHTGQFYFPDAVNTAVAQQEPYLRHQIHLTTKQEDGVYLSQDGAASILEIEPFTDGSISGYTGQITVAVDPSATPRPAGHGGPPPPKV